MRRARVFIDEVEPTPTPATAPAPAPAPRKGTQFRGKHGWMPGTRDQATRALRRTLTTTKFDGEPPPPRVGFSWCTPPRGSGFGNVEPGLECAIRLRSGAVFVGTLVAVTRLIVIFRRWGAHGDLRIQRADVGGACLLGPHTWAEAQEVKRRQAGGEPALSLGAGPARSSRSGAGSTGEKE